MAKALLNDPVEVKIAVSKPTDKVEQSVCICHEPQKTGILTHLFNSVNGKRVIVFASSKLKVKGAGTRVAQTETESRRDAL